jgi:hypothetical protein
LILRNQLLTLCGYLAIPAVHPWHGKPHTEIDAYAHGGLTFAGYRTEEDFWVGFDCNHAHDLCPWLTWMPFLPDNLKGPLLVEVYRDIDYVKNQIKGLVDQASAARS